MNDKTYKFEAVIEPVPDHHGAFVRFPCSIRKEFDRGRVRVLATFDGVPYRGSRCKVSRTQITFMNKRGFAFVSFLPCRRAKDRPAVWVTVTFGPGYRKESPRINAATEPYPGRWTHHVLVGSVGEIDSELMGWLQEAAAFSATKRGNRSPGMV